MDGRSLRGGTLIEAGVAEREAAGRPERPRSWSSSAGAAAAPAELPR